MSADEGWFEIEEEVPVSCGDMFRLRQHEANVQHEAGTHTMVIKRRIRFSAPPSASARKWLENATVMNGLL